jgi:hypothetical protein
MNFSGDMDEWILNALLSNDKMIPGGTNNIGKQL